MDLRSGVTRLVISAPTGAGKTEIAMAMLEFGDRQVLARIVRR